MRYPGFIPGTWVVLIISCLVCDTGKCDCYLDNLNGSLKQSPASTHSQKAVDDKPN